MNKKILTTIFLILTLISYGQPPSTNRTGYWTGTINSGDSTLSGVSAKLLEVDFDLNLGYIPLKTGAFLVIDGDTIAISTINEWKANYNYDSLIFYKIEQQTLHADLKENLQKRITEIATYSIATDANSYFSVIPYSATWLEVGVGKTYTTIQSGHDAAGVGDTVIIYESDYDLVNTKLVLSKSINMQAVADASITSTVTSDIIRASGNTRLGGLELRASGLWGIYMPGNNHKFEHLHIKDGVSRSVEVAGNNYNSEIESSYIHDRVWINCSDSVNITFDACYFFEQEFRFHGAAEKGHVITKYSDLINYTLYHRGDVDVSYLYNSIETNSDDFLGYDDNSHVSTIKMIGNSIEITDAYRFIINEANAITNKYDFFIQENVINVNNISPTRNDFAFYALSNSDSVYLTDNYIYDKTNDNSDIRFCAINPVGNSKVVRILNNYVERKGYSQNFSSMVSIGIEEYNVDTSYKMDVIIEGNQFVSDGHFTDTVGTGHILLVQNEHAIVRYNYFGGGNPAFVLKGYTNLPDSSEGYGNVLVNNLAGFVNRGTNGAKFYNNLIVRDKTIYSPDGSLGNGYGMGLIETAIIAAPDTVPGRGTFYNNLVYDAAPADPGYSLFLLDVESEPYLTSDYNLFYSVNNNSISTLDNTWADYQLNSYDQNSINADPLLNSDNVPATSSPARGAGTDLSAEFTQLLDPSANFPGPLLKTINGWDIGAYELFFKTNGFLYIPGEGLFSVPGGIAYY